MAISVFDDKSVLPNEEELAAHLGPAMPLWDKLGRDIAALCPGADGLWKYPTKAAGWTWVDALGKRNLLYRQPCVGWARVTLVLGEKAVERALLSPIPDEVKQAIKEAKPYVEGRSVVVKLRAETDLAVVMELLRAKMDV